MIDKINQKLSNNFGYKLAALFFAVFLWFYVSAEKNPPIDRVVEIPISYENLQDGFIVVEQQKSVGVRIRGPKESVNSLRESDFSATADLGDASLGENVVELKVVGPRMIEILTKTPSSLKINVDRLGEKNVPVQVAVLGKPEEGFSAFTPSVKPGQILLKGPETLLDQIAVAKVEVDITGADKNLTLNVPVALFSGENKIVELNQKQLIPSTVEVFIPVAEDTPSKTVPIKPMIIGKPGEGYEIARVFTDPETIKIVGPYDKLDEVDQIATLPIYITNITEDLSQEIELKVPAGVTILYDSKVKVLVDVRENEVQQTINVPITIKNQNEQQQVTLTTKNVKIKVQGKKEVIEQIDKEHRLVAYVDVTGLDNGIHTITVQFDNPKGIRVLSIEPKEVEVQVVVETVPEEVPESSEDVSQPANN